VGEEARRRIELEPDEAEFLDRVAEQPARIATARVDARREEDPGRERLCDGCAPLHDFVDADLGLAVREAPVEALCYRAVDALAFQLGRQQLRTRVDQAALDVEISRASRWEARGRPARRDGLEPAARKEAAVEPVDVGIDQRRIELHVDSPPARLLAVIRRPPSAEVGGDGARRLA
jgi:hypothetical protein